jgi:hypothetical protein
MYAVFSIATPAGGFSKSQDITSSWGGKLQQSYFRQIRHPTLPYIQKPKRARAAMKAPDISGKSLRIMGVNHL